MNFETGQKNKNDLIADIENAINLSDTSLKDPQKTIYKTLLEAMIFILNEKKVKLNELTSEEIIKEEIISEKIPIPVLKLSKELKISVEDIKDTFKFSDNEKIELNTPFDGENWIQQQFKSTLCLLTAYSICYDITEISSKELIEQLESLGIESIPNLSPNLQKKDFNKYIRVIGGRNALKTYKIKNYGIKKGKELIKELIPVEE